MDQKEKSEQSRAEILETAVRVFNEKRYEKTSVSAICREGSISKGRMYYYYENKEQLFLDAVKHIYHLLAENMEQFQPNQAAEIESNLLAFFDHWQSFWKTNISFGYFIGNAKYSAPPEIQLQVLETRKESIEAQIKPIIRKIFALYFPNSSERQRIMTDFAWTTLEYISADVGLTKLNARVEINSDFYNTQRLLYQEILNALLYGCLPPELRPAGK